VSAQWVDSHCHLQERFRSADEAGDAGEVLRRAAMAGVAAVVCVGTDEATSIQAIEMVDAAHRGELGEDLPALRAVVGLHPHEASHPTSWLRPLLDDRHELVVGVGEAGLDYHYEHSPRGEQRRCFAEQIRIARDFDLALVIHARDAWGDLFDVLESEGVPAETVLHCFTGGPEEALRCVEMGMTVSFSGIASFKNADDVRAAAALLPLERILVETDSPFLAPVPHRGEQNEPAYVAMVGHAVAAARGIDADELAEATSKTAARIFKVSTLT